MQFAEQPRHPQERRSRKATAELFINGMLASEQTQFRPVKAPTKEFIDRHLKVLFACKDANGFVQRFWLFIHVTRFVKRWDGRLLGLSVYVRDEFSHGITCLPSAANFFR